MCGVILYCLLYYIVHTYHIVILSIHYNIHYKILRLNYRHNTVYYSIFYGTYKLLMKTPTYIKNIPLNC